MSRSRNSRAARIPPLDAAALATEDCSAGVRVQVNEMPTVFLSYAHDDNRVPEGLKGSGWVSFFDNSLRIELD